MATQTPPSTAAADVDPRRWIALAVVLTAAFMVLLDITIVVVAIPTVQSNLHAKYGEVEFVLAGYQLAYAIGLITGGRLGDIYGRKRIFITGVTGFTIASALCGLAQSPGMLIASRVLQGLMAAMMFPQVLSVIQVSFLPSERAKAFGIFGAMLGLATVAGPLLGGILTEANIAGQSWRPIFLVNVPIGIGAVIAASMLLHESRSPHALRLDIPGVALVTVGLFMLAYPLVEGRDLGWPGWSIAMLIASIPVLAVFAWYEVQKGKRDGSPLVQPILFRERAFVVGLIVAMMFFAGIPSFFLTFSVFVQIGLGFTALQTGFTVAPFSVGSFFASAISIRLAPKLGKYLLTIGAGALAVGMVAVRFTVEQTGTSLHGYELIPSLFLCGIGLGFVAPPLINIVLAGIHTAHAGSASGVLTTVQQIGGALGVAVIGLIFFGLVSSNANTATADVRPHLEQQLLSAHLPAPAVNTASNRFATCFQDRANETDPTVVPPSCSAPPGNSRVSLSGFFADAATAAKQQDFYHSFRDTVWFTITIFGLVGALALLLPSGAIPQRQAR